MQACATSNQPHSFVSVHWIENKARKKKKWSPRWEKSQSQDESRSINHAFQFTVPARPTAPRSASSPLGPALLREKLFVVWLRLGSRRAARWRWPLPAEGCWQFAWGEKEKKRTSSLILFLEKRDIPRRPKRERDGHHWLRSHLSVRNLMAWAKLFEVQSQIPTRRNTLSCTVNLLFMLTFSKYFFYLDET